MHHLLRPFYSHRNTLSSVVITCSLSRPPFSLCISTQIRDNQQEYLSEILQSQVEEQQRMNQKGEISSYSPSRIQKLIASQSDPLLAKEVFDLASRQPNFRHTNASFCILILKLGRSRHFSLMESVVSTLKKAENCSVSPSIFSRIIQFYGDAGLPNEAIRTFYRILEFKIRPNTKLLNLILGILVDHREFIRPAFDLFKIAHKYGVNPNTVSYNIMMRAFCLNGDLSIAYSLFNKMSNRDLVPDVNSYRILIQGFCRKSQVNKAVDLLEDMLNKGFVPDSYSYSTILNSLCRKKQLKEAYKILCRMKLKGCKPDLVHYNTVILGFCRESRVLDACKVLEEMNVNGCFFPNSVSYGTIIGGLCNMGLYDKARNYLNEMLSKGFTPHFSTLHLLVKGFCNVGNLDEACGVLEEFLGHGQTPHVETWIEILSNRFFYDVDGEKDRFDDVFNVILKIDDIKPDTRIVDVGSCLEEYLIKKKVTTRHSRSPLVPIQM